MSNLRQILQPSMQVLARIHPSISKEYELFIDTTIEKHPLTKENLHLLDSAIRALSINLQVKGIYQGNQDDASSPIVIEQVKNGLKQFFDCVSTFLSNSMVGINALLKHPMYANQLMPVAKVMREAGLQNYIDMVCEKPEYADKFAKLLIYLSSSPHHHLVNHKTITLLMKSAKQLDTIHDEISKRQTITSQEFDVMLRKFQQFEIKVSDKSFGLFSRTDTISTSVQNNTHTPDKKGPSV